MMPKFNDHLADSLRRYPGISQRIHEYVHRWMDDPSNWPVGIPYENTEYTRRNGYNGRTHRKVRHDPEKVANALCGGSEERWYQIFYIASCHRDLDGMPDQ